jgi:hypothetical protein
MEIGFSRLPLPKPYILLHFAFLPSSTSFAIPAQYEMSIMD